MFIAFQYLRRNNNIKYIAVILARTYIAIFTTVFYYFNVVQLIYNIPNIYIEVRTGTYNTVLTYYYYYYYLSFLYYYYYDKSCE